MKWFEDIAAKHERMLGAIRADRETPFRERMEAISRVTEQCHTELRARARRDKRFFIVLLVVLVVIAWWDLRLQGTETDSAASACTAAGGLLLSTRDELLCVPRAAVLWRRSR